MREVTPVGLEVFSDLLPEVILLIGGCAVLFGPLVEPANTPDTSTGLTRDLSRREVLILTPIALVCIGLGVYPKPMLESIEPAIRTHVVASRTLAESGVRTAAASPAAAGNRADIGDPCVETLHLQSGPRYLA